MKQLVAANIMRTTVEDNYFNLVANLNTKLGIPTRLLGVPQDDLRGYVNAQRILEFRFGPNSVSSHEGNYATTDAESNQSACYKPLLPGLMVSTHVLEQDADAARLSEEALLEILILHELTHVAMIGKYVRMNDPVSREWVNSTEIRYIHEAVALKACESTYADMYKVANEADIKNYLNYVRNESETSTEGKYYTPYYSRFQKLPVDQFWKSLAESTSFQFDSLPD